MNLTMGRCFINRFVGGLETLDQCVEARDKMSEIEGRSGVQEWSMIYNFN